MTSMYRNRDLLDLAARSPRCMMCQRPNDRTVVPAHSNALRHGKGMGIKAHDLPAFLCRACHDEVDGRAGTYQKPMREALWADAMFFTFLWLLQEGHLQVVVNPAQPAATPGTTPLPIHPVP